MNIAGSRYIFELNENVRGITREVSMKAVGLEKKNKPSFNPQLSASVFTESHYK